MADSCCFMAALTKHSKIIIFQFLKKRTIKQNTIEPIGEVFSL